MADAAAPGHAGLVDALELDGDERVLDVGGADGALARRLLTRHPHLRCTVLDRPALAPLAHGVDFVAGDAFADAWPPADVVVLSLVLLDWDTEQKQALLAKAHDALPAGGRLIVLDRFDEPRPDGSLALLHALHLLVTVGPAHPFDAEQLATWLAAAGFERPDVQRLTGGFSLAVARKVL
jgi:SAM-dependent methyltransferase